MGEFLQECKLEIGGSFEISLSFDHRSLMALPIRMGMLLMEGESSPMVIDTGVVLDVLPVAE